MGEHKKLRDYRRDRSGRTVGLSVTALLHVVVLYALLQHHPVSSAITPPQPLMVSFVALAEAPKIAPPPVTKPKPVVEHRAVRQPQRVQPVASAPLISATAATPASDPVSTTPAPADPAPSSATPVVNQSSAAPFTAPEPVVTQPTFNADYLQNPAPRYPPLARRMRQEGKVVLRVLVDAGGGASRIEVRDSSGSDVLDEAALDAVKRWRFLPARRGAQPVAAWVFVPVTFTLQG